MAKLGAWLCAGLAALGCGGRAGSDGARDETGGVAGRGGVGSFSGAGAGGVATSGAAASGASGASTAGLPASDGTIRLGPWIGAPSPEGDGRLPDVPETVPGGYGIGWDLCYADQPLSAGECVDCAASRGTDFLVAEDSLEVSIEAQRPQLYFYFEPPQGAAALWFDLAWLDGARGGEVMFWETNTGCEPVGEGQLFDVSRMLTGERGAWTSACIPLNEARKFSGLGLRLGAAGRIGLDAIRFGASCRGE